LVLGSVVAIAGVAIESGLEYGTHSTSPRRRIVRISLSNRAHGVLIVRREYGVTPILSSKLVIGLERFGAKWAPDCVRKMRQNSKPEARSDLIGMEKALLRPIWHVAGETKAGRLRNSWDVIASTAFLRLFAQRARR
jgi:hypothetical protein